MNDWICSNIITLKWSKIEKYKTINALKIIAWSVRWKVDTKSACAINKSRGRRYAIKLILDNEEDKNKILFELFFYIFIFLSIINFYFLWISAGYLDIDIFKNISTVTNDRPGNIEMREGLIGHHYFGDFLLQYIYAKEGSYWINDIIPSNIYPPISNLIFDIFTIFPIMQGFIIYIITVSYTHLTLPTNREV